MTATRLDGAGLINERLDRVGAAAAFCGAAKRSVDPAGARPRRACDDASHVRIAEDIAGTDDHRELSRVIGSTEVRTGFLGQRDPPPPCFGDVRSTVRVPHGESRGLTNGDSPFYALGHKALFRHLTDEALAAHSGEARLGRNHRSHVSIARYRSIDRASVRWTSAGIIRSRRLSWPGQRTDITPGRHPQLQTRQRAFRIFDL